MQFFKTQQRYNLWLTKNIQLRSIFVNAGKQQGYSKWPTLKHKSCSDHCWPIITLNQVVCDAHYGKTFVMDYEGYTFVFFIKI